MKAALWPERWPLDCGKRDPATRMHPGLCCLLWAKETLGTPIYNDQFLCLDENAPILMADFGEKKIRDIRLGDEVIGFDFPKTEGHQTRLVKAKVLWTHSHLARLIEAKTSAGRIIRCTPEHKWLSGKRHRIRDGLYKTLKIGNGKREISALVSVYTPHPPKNAEEQRPHDVCENNGIHSITSIQNIGISHVCNIQTTTGNYVAYGYASKNCDPSGLVGRLMKTEWLEPYWQPPLPGDLELVAGVDPAFSKETSADYTAIVTVGWSPTTKTMYLVNVERQQIAVPEQLDWIVEHHAEFRESRIIIESNALQGLFVVQPLIRETLLPIIPRKSFKDKTTRILAITPYFETKKLVVRKDMHAFISEYIQFPDGEHDDMLDALELAVSDIVSRHIRPETGFGTGGGTFKSFTQDWSRWQQPYGSRGTGKEDPDKGLR